MQAKSGCIAKGGHTMSKPSTDLPATDEIRKVVILKPTKCGLVTARTAREESEESLQIVIDEVREFKLTHAVTAIVTGQSGIRRADVCDGKISLTPDFPDD